MHLVIHDTKRRYNGHVKQSKFRVGLIQMACSLDPNENLAKAEWRTADYARRNLASLQTAVYGGQAVAKPFLGEMLKMAPQIATGLGLTETSGFCTYTALTNDAGALARGIGWPMPAYPMSIRQPMKGDGSAGAEVLAGEIGHVCFSGPQTFLGYVNDPEATAAALSTDGWLYRSEE